MSETATPPDVTLTPGAAADAREEQEALITKFLSIQGKKTTTEFNRELGRIIWDPTSIAVLGGGWQQQALQEAPPKAESQPAPDTTGTSAP